MTALVGEISFHSACSYKLLMCVMCDVKCSGALRGQNTSESELKR